MVCLSSITDYQICELMQHSIFPLVSLYSNQDVLLLKVVMETVLKALASAVSSHISNSALRDGDCGGDCDGDSTALIELISNCTKDIKGRRGSVLKDHWLIVISSLTSADNILKKYITVTVELVTNEMRREVSIAMVKVATALVILLSPLSVIDPLVMEGSHFEYLKQLVRLLC